MRDRSVTHISADEAFRAIADPTRRALLDLLRAGSQSAGKIAEAFPVSRPAISKHLRVLRRARLVVEQRSGRHRLYQLNPAPLERVDAWLRSYRDFWRHSLANLKAFVENEEQAAASHGARSRKRPDRRTK